MATNSLIFCEIAPSDGHPWFLKDLASFLASSTLLASLVVVPAEAVGLWDALRAFQARQGRASNPQPFSASHASSQPGPAERPLLR